MKIKLANFVARLLAQNGITQCFSVNGETSAPLSGGFLREPGISVLFLHQEQACSMAAEGYARVYNKPAVCLVDACPGAANAVPGVVAAWNASVPMIVISGQTRSDQTSRWSGVGIRRMGDKEFDITRSAECFTKYAKLLLEPDAVRAEVEKCIYLSQTGRPGPVWLDIPVDLQNMTVEDGELESFDYDYYEDEKEKMLDAIDELEEAAHGIPSYGYTGADLSDPLLNVGFMKQKWQTAYERLDKESPLISEILNRLQDAKRPLLYTGGGIRTAGCEDLFLQVADRLGIPVVVSLGSQDILPTEHPLMAGRAGEGGDDPGNAAVESADVIFAIGARLGLRQVGGHYSAWARDAFTIVCDIDEEELKKPSLYVNLPVHADAAELLKAMNEQLKARKISGHEASYNDIDLLCEEGYPDDGDFLFEGGDIEGRSWRQTCALRMGRMFSEKAKEAEEGFVTETLFYDTLSRVLPPETVTVAGCRTSSGEIPFWYVNQGSRLIYQDSCGGRGYELSAAIGVCTASHDVEEANGAFDEERRLVDKAKAIGEMDSARKDPWWKGRHEIFPSYFDHDAVCITDIHSLTAVLGELETVSRRHMPVKIFVLHRTEDSVISRGKLTESEEYRIFAGKGTGLTYPDISGIGASFGIPYFCLETDTDLREDLEDALSPEGPVLCEVMIS